MADKVKLDSNIYAGKSNEAEHHNVAHLASSEIASRTRHQESGLFINQGLFKLSWKQWEQSYILNPKLASQ